MFKNSEDQKCFEATLRAYQQEFGTEKLIVFVPKVAETISPDVAYEPMTIKFWNKRYYAIRVKQFTASFDFQPSE